MQTMYFRIIKIEELLGAIKCPLQGLTLAVDTLLPREPTQDKTDNALARHAGVLHVIPIPGTRPGLKKNCYITG